MRWASRLVMWWRSVFLRHRVEHDLDAELRFHVDQQIQENLAAGMSLADARSAAWRSMGGFDQVKEQCRDSLGATWPDDLRRDVRYAVRTLGRSRGFTTVAMLTLAVGIGANTAFFSLVRSVLLEPLPFRDPDRLVMLYESSADGRYPYNVAAGGMFQEWQRGASGFEQMAIWGASGYNLSGTGGQLPEKIDGAKCSWNLFATLGVQPAVGRSFAASDDDPAADPTVILSWNLWQRRFAGDRSIIGQDILLEGERWTVIGVMPTWFSYPDPEIQLWTPIYHETRPAVMRAFDDHEFRVVARLRPRVTPAEGLSQIDTIEKRVHAEHLDQTIGNSANILPLLDAMVHDYKTPLYVLLAAAGCFLLIACLNIASLFVARSAARRKELAIRTALGGTRGRLVREQLTESFVLSAISGVAAIGLAYVALQWTAHSEWMAQLRLDIPRGDSIQIDGLVLLFAVILTLVSGSVVGLLPTFGPTAGIRVLETLQESSRVHTSGRGRARLRKTLLSLEIGLTVVLLIAAGLLLKTYQELRSSDMGCATENVLTLRLTPPKPRYDAQRRVALFEAVIERVRHMPGVQRAAMATTVPGQGYEGDNPFTIVEHAPLAKGQFQVAIRRGVDPEYFAAMQIPILRGRAFRENERLDRARSMIISDLFARRFFPGEDALGKHLRVNLNGQELAYELVGVVGDTRLAVSRPVEPMMYFPLYSGLFGRATIAVKSTRDPNGLALPIQKVVAEMDADLPVSDVLTMEQLVGRSTLKARFNAGLVLAFAGLSLLLACVGLYGVLSYLVTQRTSEIGIRLALGARRRDVLQLVLIDGLRSTGIGLALGLLGATSGSKLIESALYGVRPLDPGVFVSVAFLLSILAMAACSLPAWRAARLDPVGALRNQ
jgi:putative ABC transport system permease protein